MAGRLLLDTNAVIALLSADPAVRSRLADVDEVFVPVVVVGELLFGALKSSRPEENVRTIEEFAAAAALLSCDVDTARHYGALKTRLRAVGNPIPENDLWIAAVSRQHDLTLLSRDAHFSAVEGLACESW